MRRMLVATALIAAIATAYPSRAAAQQSRSELRHQDQDALVSRSRDSGLAQTLDTFTLPMEIERVPRPVDAEDPSRFIGLIAVSRRGEKVGEILALARSPAGGLLAVVDASEFLGVAVRPVALPIEPGGTDRNGNVRLQASREELEKLPIFTAGLDKRHRDSVAANREP